MIRNLANAPTRTENPGKQLFRPTETSRLLIFPIWIRITVSISMVSASGSSVKAVLPRTPYRRIWPNRLEQSAWLFPILVPIAIGPVKERANTVSTAISFLHLNNKENLLKLKHLRRQQSSPQQHTANHHIVILPFRINKRPPHLKQKSRARPEMQGIMAVISHTVDEDTLFAIDEGRCVFEGSLEGDVRFFDDLGDVFEELGPGFLPFFGFPVVDFVVVGVAVGFGC